MVACAVSGQSKERIPYLLVQGGMHGYNEMSLRPTASFSLGARLKKVFGVGANVQYLTLKGNKSPFIPVNAEISYLPSGDHFRLCGSFQIGKAFYSAVTEEETISSFYTSTIRTKGGLYLAPAVGFLAPVTQGTDLIVTIAYIRTHLDFSTTKTAGTLSSSYSESSTELSGFRVLAGLRF